MATTEIEGHAASEKMRENLKRIEVLTGRLAAALAAKHQIRPSLQGPGPEFWAKSFGAFWTEALTNPLKLWESQLGYWTRVMQNAMETQAALAAGEAVEPGAEDLGGSDPRFANPLWRTHPYFHALKQQYFLTARTMEEAVNAVEGVTEQDRSRMRYFTRQIIDMMAPTNFLATNPEALARAVETEGESLVQGLENMIADLERHNGELIVTLSDPDAFAVGENIGTTPGEVVFRNRMFELIQYAPATETVHSIPLVIFPPWINKFYVLDLTEKNSLIRWLVGQGFTVFVVSWVNPDESYAGVGMEDYINEGFLTALGEVKAITGSKTVNAVGYCIAGTTLSLTLALLAKRGDTSVGAATFFTALTDFSDRGEVGVFLENDFVDGIEAEAREKGIMSSLYMSRTFSYLRANDLIYRPAINAWMMGKKPPAFDLLYWNGDSTNLPGRMAVEYLRGLCQRDEFANGAGFDCCGERLRISDITTPLCAVAAESDHIAAWRSSYRGIAKMGSQDKTFILSEAGHIAGIVNPPTKNKYGHWVNADWPADPDDWVDQGAFTPGSWWPRWGEWLAERSGEMVAARAPGDKDHPSLGPAPGSYVRVKPHG